MGLTSENAQEILLARGLGNRRGHPACLRRFNAATLDIPEEEVDEMDFDQAAAIGLTIISQNLERIKKLLAPDYGPDQRP